MFKSSRYIWVLSKSLFIFCSLASYSINSTNCSVKTTNLTIAENYCNSIQNGENFISLTIHSTSTYFLFECHGTSRLVCVSLLDVSKINASILSLCEDYPIWKEQNFTYPSKVMIMHIGVVGVQLRYAMNVRYKQYWFWATASG